MVNDFASLYWYSKQLPQLDVGDLLTRGKSVAHDCVQAAGEFIQKPFKIQLGRGLYGECLVCEQHALAFYTDFVTCVCQSSIASCCKICSAQFFCLLKLSNCIALAKASNSASKCLSFNGTMLLASRDRHVLFKKECLCLSLMLSSFTD